MNLRLARYIDRWVGLGVCFLLWGLARLLSAGRAVPPLLGTTPPRKVPGTPRRVLAIKFYGLGNIAMILPTLRALQAEGEDVAIDFLTLPGNVALLRKSGLVSEARTEPTLFATRWEWRNSLGSWTPLSSSFPTTPRSCISQAWSTPRWLLSLDRPSPGSTDPGGRATSCSTGGSFAVRAYPTTI